jgi:hypothetical protein
VTSRRIRPGEDLCDEAETQRPYVGGDRGSILRWGLAKNIQNGSFSRPQCYHER